MFKVLIRWAAVTGAIVAAARLFPGVHVFGWKPAALAALALGALNYAARPFFVSLMVPPMPVAMAAAAVVLNALFFAVVGAVVGGIYVDGLWPCVLVGAEVTLVVCALAAFKGPFARVTAFSPFTGRDLW